MPTIEASPSAKALRRAIAQTPPYRRKPLWADHLDLGDYVVLYRPMADQWSWAPSWCCLLVVPSEEERS